MPLLTTVRCLLTFTIAYICYTTACCTITDCILIINIGTRGLWYEEVGPGQGRDRA